MRQWNVHFWARWSKDSRKLKIHLKQLPPYKIWLLVIGHQTAQDSDSWDKETRWGIPILHLIAWRVFRLQVQEGGIQLQHCNDDLLKFLNQRWLSGELKAASVHRAKCQKTAAQRQNPKDCQKFPLWAFSWVHAKKATTWNQRMSLN
jgi:hypothetical protein